MNYYCYCCGERKVEAEREREKKRLDLSYFSRDDDKEIGLPGFFSFRDFLLLLQGRPSSSHCPYFAFFFLEEKEEEEETFSLDFTILRL